MWNYIKKLMLSSLIYLMVTTGIELRYGLKFVSMETPDYWIGSWLLIVAILLLMDALLTKVKK